METIFELIKGKEREEMLADMSKYQRTLFKELEENIEKASNYKLSDLIFDFDEEFVQRLLDLEAMVYLREHKEDNRRNGYTKNIKVKMGEREIEFNRPRLRHEEGFDSIVIPKRTKFMEEIKDHVITLYTKNNSLNDIKNILKEMFNINISTATLSELARQIKSDVISWRTKKLEKCYFTMNIDCTYIKIRDNKNLQQHRIPVYIAVGTKLDGHKEIVGMYLGNEDEEKNVIDELYNKDIGESKMFWRTVLSDIKDRGVEKVLFIISDGIVGIEGAIEEEFPGTRYQRCVVHLSMNVKKYIAQKEYKEILGDFKKLYSASSLEEANREYEEFCEKYKKKKTLVRKVQEYYEYIKPLYNYPKNIRKYIYTNNIVESANSKVKRGFYGRGALPNVESAINIIYVNLKDLEEKWQKRKVENWDNIFNEISVVFKGEIKEYVK